MSLLDLNQKMMSQFLHRYEFLAEALSGTADVMEETYRSELFAERRELEKKISSIARNIYSLPEFPLLSDKWQKKVWIWQGNAHHVVSSGRHITVAYLEEEAADARTSELDQFLILLNKAITDAQLDPDVKALLGHLASVDKDGHMFLQQGEALREALRYIFSQLPLAQLKEIAKFVVYGHFPLLREMVEPIHSILLERLHRSYLEIAPKEILEVASLAFHAADDCMDDKLAIVQYILGLLFLDINGYRTCLELLLTLPIEVRGHLLINLFDRMKQDLSDSASVKMSEHIQLMTHVINGLEMDADKEDLLQELISLIPNGPFPKEMIELAQSLPSKNSIKVIYQMAIAPGAHEWDVCRLINSCFQGNFNWEYVTLEPFLKDNQGQSREWADNRETQHSGLLGLPNDVLEKIMYGLTVRDRALFSGTSRTLKGAQERVTLNAYADKKEEIKQFARFLQDSLSSISSFMDIDFDALVINAMFADSSPLSSEKDIVDFAQLFGGLPLDTLQKMKADFAVLSFPLMGAALARFFDKMLQQKAFMYRAIFDSQVEGEQDPLILATALEVLFLISDQTVQMALLQDLLTLSPKQKVEKVLWDEVYRSINKAPRFLRPQLDKIWINSLEAYLASVEEDYHKNCRDLVQTIKLQLKNIIETVDPVEQLQSFLAVREEISYIVNNPNRVDDFFIFLSGISDVAGMLPIVYRDQILRIIFDRLCNLHSKRALTDNEIQLVRSIVDMLAQSPEEALALLSHFGLEPIRD